MLTSCHWYLARNRQKVGPLSPAEMRQMVRSGQLSPGDMVLQEGTQKWVEARSVTGLFGEETVPLPRVDVPAEETGTAVANPHGVETVAEAHGEPIPVRSADFPTLPGYDILAELGRGGMGVVYKARDRQLRHLVAIKMPLPHCIARQQDRERFLREARAAAGLRHPNICPIHRVEEADGRPFIVLAFIQGEDLRAWMNRQPRTARACAEVVARLARAVEYAHQHGVIHRDIKPGNTMIEADTGEPVLMDFGLAKELDQQDAQLSQSGQILGTPAYMAPEQAGGHVHQVGPLADVYSLGALLYHLLCKRPPFEGNVGEIIRKVQTEEPTPPRKLVASIHRDLETICLKALAKEPARRYASAGALAEDLERFAAGEAILARREGLFARTRRWLRRNPVAAGSLTAVLVAFVVASFVVAHVLRGNALKHQEDALRAEFNAAEWTPEFLEELEERIDALGREAPERGPVLRQELFQAVKSWAEGLLKLPRLDEKQHEQIRSALALLEPRDGKLAEELRGRYAKRRESMDLAFRLTQPFEQLAEVFELGRDLPVQRRESALAYGGGGWVLTRVPSRGTFQLEAVFAPSWQQAPMIGLLLNGGHSGSGVDGYTFLLRAPEGRPPGSEARRQLSFAEARAEDAAWTLEILRNGARLRQQPIPAAEIPAGPLRLEARHDRDRLTFQVNSLKPVEFRDLFPPSRVGVCGLYWPAGVGLESLKGYRRGLSADPSPLERGDDLYTAGQLPEALAYYREQGRLSGSTPTGQEARAKEGLTLAALDRHDEAAAVLEPLAGEPGKLWPHVAAAHLWVIRLRQKRSDDAELILDNLLLRRQQGVFSDCALTLPAEYTAEVRQVYVSRWEGINLLRHDPDRVRNIERAVQVNELLDHGPMPWGHLQQARVRSYRRVGQGDRAAQIARDLVLNEPRESTLALYLLPDYGWAAREVGRPGEVLPELDRRLFERANVYRQNAEPLLVERARLLVALKRTPEAAKDLEAYLRVPNLPPWWYRHTSDAWLMLGFLREDRGDAAGAKDAWRQAQFRRDLANALSDSGGGLGMINLVIAGSLGGDLTDQDIQTLLDKVLARYANESGGAAIVRNNVPLPPAAFREAWKTKRGKQAARRIVFQDGPFEEYLRLAPTVLIMELLFRDAFAGTMSPDQDALVWKLSEDSVKAVMNGTVKEGQVVLLGAAWKGVTGVFGWAGVRGSLAPELRGPIAYVLGHRYLFRKNPADAKKFFEQARSEAAKDSPLQRLSQSELDKLK
jgi:predicted Ser/Thr protein kinase